MRESVQLTRGRPSTTLKSTATTLEALHILNIALNATSLEREGFLARVALRAGTNQPTANRSKIYSHSIELEDWCWPHAGLTIASTLLFEVVIPDLEGWRHRAMLRDMYLRQSRNKATVPMRKCGQTALCGVRTCYCGLEPCEVWGRDVDPQVSLTARVCRGMVYYTDENSRPRRTE